MINRKSLIYFLAFCFILSLVWSLLLHLNSQKDTVWNFGFNVIGAFFYLFAGVLALINVKAIGKSENIGKAFFYLGLGLISFAAALLVWFYYNFILKVDIPYPSLADVFFVIFYPLAVLGFLYFIRAKSETMGTILLVKSFLILFVTSVLVLTFNRLFIIDNSQSQIAQLFNLMYPVGDIFVGSVAFIGLGLTKGRMREGFFLLILAALIEVMADLIFSYRTSINIYWNGDISDVLYTFGGFLFSIGMVDSVSSVLGNPIDPRLSQEIPTK